MKPQSASEMTFPLCLPSASVPSFLSIRRIQSKKKKKKNSGSIRIETKGLLRYIFSSRDDDDDERNTNVNHYIIWKNGLMLLHSVHWWTLGSNNCSVKRCITETYRDSGHGSDTDMKIRDHAARVHRVRARDPLYSSGFSGFLPTLNHAWARTPAFPPRVRDRLRIRALTEDPFILNVAGSHSFWLPFVRKLVQVWRTDSRFRFSCLTPVCVCVCALPSRPNGPWMTQERLGPSAACITSLAASATLIHCYRSIDQEAL